MKTTTERTPAMTSMAQQTADYMNRRANEANALHAVFATDGNHNTYRVSDPMSWGAAQRTWEKLDDQRRAGLLPQAKFFEVRSVTLGPDKPLVGPDVRSHDRYDNAPLNLTMTRPVASGQRGYGKVQDAARAAWKLNYPTFRSRYDKTGTDKQARTGVQGRGGWFYYPNGTTAAQGLDGLARVAQQRNLVVQGADGRWYVVDVSEL